MASDRTKGNGFKSENKKFQLQWKTCYFEGYRALEQSAQSGCVFSFSETAWVPVQPAVGEIALAGSLD